MLYAIHFIDLCPDRQADAMGIKPKISSKCFTSVQCKIPHEFFLHEDLRLALSKYLSVFSIDLTCVIN